jgi:hypothetical protein
MLKKLVAVLFALSLVASACSGAGSSVPTTPGQYSVQKDSVHFDGERYQLYYADSSGSLHQLQTRNLKMVRDPDRTYLDVPQSGDAVLHMREDEPITVNGQDHQGAFSSPWFPFLLGATLGNAFGGGFGGGRGGQTVIINNPAPGETGTYGAGTPAYRYPPTGTFGRDDQLHGSLDSSKAQVPDYSKVQPAPYATAGNASGTGGGTAASNKSAPSGQPGASNATSAQSSGSGGGTAASSKGGFASGSQSYTSRAPSIGAGSGGALNGPGNTGKPSTGISGGKGIGGARPSVGRR